MRVGAGEGAGSSLSRPVSRLSSFGFSGTIAHGAFSALGGETVRGLGVPCAASRYRGQLADGVGLSPSLQTDAQTPTAARLGDSCLIRLAGLRLALGSSSSRFAQRRVAGTPGARTEAVVADHRAGLCEPRGRRPLRLPLALVVRGGTVQPRGRGARARAHSGQGIRNAPPGRERPRRDLHHEAAQTCSRVFWDAGAPPNQTAARPGSGTGIGSTGERTLLDVVFDIAPAHRGLLAVTAASRIGADLVGVLPHAGYRSQARDAEGSPARARRLVDCEGTSQVLRFGLARCR